MATKHAKCMRCLVWQMALGYWKEFRTILLTKIELRIRRLCALIRDFKRQYKLLKEPDVEMTKAYKVAGYYHEIAMRATVRRMRNKSKSSVNEEQNVESIDKKQEYDLATFIEYICTGEESQDEFEQENSESDIAPSAPTANDTEADEHGQGSSGSSASTANDTEADEHGQGSSGSSAPTANDTEADEHGQGSSGSSAPTAKGTGTDELGQQSSGSQSASSSASSTPKEKYTGTKPKNVKRLERDGGELVSASNIQVPHVIENLKHATAILDLSLRRKNDADDEKTIKNGQSNYMKKDEFRDTDSNGKICAPPRKREPPLDRRLGDAGDNGKVCRDKDDEDDKGLIPLPRNEKEPVALDLSMNKHWLEVEPLAPKLPELPTDFESKLDFAIRFLESYTTLHNEMELLPKIDPAMRGSIKRASQEELQKHLDRNQFVKNGVEWVALGKYKTKIKKKVLCEVDCTLSGIEITQHLLMHIFGLKTLETHNLTGEGNTKLAVGMPIAEMSTLDEHAVTDLGDFMFIMKGQPSEITRDIIDDTCAELYKAKLERVQKERELKLQKHKSKKAKKQRKYGRSR